ncbi:MAG TPA: 50S ribosomal protein L4, partial [Solirubrobacterales bacterium]|nr:50S ribosomal protein L4 [Solirubrobacterales bacterium]
DKWGAKRSTLVIIQADETGILKSFRNIPRVNVLEVGATGVVDVIGAASIVVSEAALEVLAAQSTEPDRGTGTEKDGE